MVKKKVHGILTVVFALILMFGFSGCTVKQDREETSDKYMLNFQEIYKFCNLCFTNNCNSDDPIPANICNECDTPEEACAIAFGGEAGDYSTIDLGSNAGWAYCEWGIGWDVIECAEESSEYIYGCTDPEATNYNPDATIDDQSCEYGDGTINICEDSDGGANYYDQGTVTYGSQIMEDFCSLEDGDVLVEFLCSPAMNEILNITHFCPSGCEAGVCLDPWNQTNESYTEDYFVMSEINTNCNTACGNSICVGNSGQMWNDNSDCDIMQELGGSCSTCNISEEDWAPAWFGAGAGAGNICFYNGQDAFDCDIIGGNYGAPYQRLCKCSGVVDVYGCTDPEATNYNPDATIDDGSCEYSECQIAVIDSIVPEVACSGDTVTIYGQNLCTGPTIRVLLQGWPIPSDLILASTPDKVIFNVPQGYDDTNVARSAKLMYGESPNFKYSNFLPFETGFNNGDNCEELVTLTYILHEGNNLVSFPVERTNTSIESIFPGSPNVIDQVIGEGLAAINLNGDWVGSLTDISPLRGYWVSAIHNTYLYVSGISELDNPTYTLHGGANLISFPHQESILISEAFPSSAESVIIEVIDETTQASYVNGVWSGDLNYLEPNKGYWVVIPPNANSLSFEFNGNEENGGGGGEPDLEPEES